MENKGNRVKRPTIRDVAKAAGVSQTTASYIIGKTRGGFAKKTVQRVNQAAKKLNYKANTFAKGLRTGRTELMGILSGIDFESVNHITRYQLEVGVATEAIKHGFDIIRILTSPEIEADDKANIDRVIALIRSGLIECMVLECPISGTPFIQEIQETGASFVVIGHPPQKNVYTVDSDNVLVGRMTAQHLIDLGHRRLAYIAPYQNYPFGNDRAKGFLDTCKVASVNARDLLVVRVENTTAGGYKGMQQILKKPKPYTAVIAADDYMADGAMKAIADAGLNIPDDISIVGCNNDSLAGNRADFLTTVDLDFVNIGSLAAKKAIALTMGRKITRRTITKSRFVPRGSSGPPKKSP